jgi:putative phosphoribosyl transferase
MAKVQTESEEQAVEVIAGPVKLQGSLVIPEGTRCVVLFAHGSGSSRHSPRNRYVAGILRKAGLGTLLFDLLTPKEETIDLQTARLRFDIPLLAERVAGATAWLLKQNRTASLPIGYFGASTGAAAALVAGTRYTHEVGAIVSRGGRPDLAGDALEKVQAPTLLIVGGEDDVVIDLNRQAMRRMRCECDIEIVPGAGHLFEEPGALQQVAHLAADWFGRYLK